MPPKTNKSLHSGIAFSASHCNSACPLLLAAGSRRVAGSWAFVGVHQITTFWTQSQERYKAKYRMKNGRKQILDKKIVGPKVVANYSTTNIAPKFRKKLEAYFTEVGMDLKIIDRMPATPASEISRLSQIGMPDLKLISSLDQVDNFSSPSICRTSPPALNCIVADASE